MESERSLWVSPARRSPTMVFFAHGDSPGEENMTRWAVFLTAIAQVIWALARLIEVVR